MYGFGDHESPLPETIDVLSDVVSDFMLNLVRARSPLLCILTQYWPVCLSKILRSVHP